MDPRRDDLQAILETILGTPNVYFQPPPGREMAYPCIVYKRDRSDTTFAGNRPYNHNLVYQLTVIDRNPDSDIPRRVRDLPQCLHVRNFARQDLNHDIFVLVF